MCYIYNKTVLSSQIHNEALMNELDNKLIAALSLGAIYLLFALVSILVIISKKNPFFVKQKLKLGALIISLIAVISCDTVTEKKDVITCYIQVVDYVRIDDNYLENSMVVLKKNQVSTLEGEINEIQSVAYSYAIVQDDSTIIHKDDITVADGKLDERDERFIIKIPILGDGELYELRFYNCKSKDISDSTYWVTSYDLLVVE